MRAKHRIVRPDPLEILILRHLTVNPYTITFDSAGGSAVSKITQNYLTTVAAPTAPTKTGYTFEGWDPALPGTIGTISVWASAAADDPGGPQTRRVGRRSSGQPLRDHT